MGGIGILISTFFDKVRSASYFESLFPASTITPPSSVATICAFPIMGGHIFSIPAMGIPMGLSMDIPGISSFVSLANAGTGNEKRQRHYCPNDHFSCLFSLCEFFQAFPAEPSTCSFLCLTSRQARHEQDRDTCVVEFRGFLLKVLRMRRHPEAPVGIDMTLQTADFAAFRSCLPGPNGILRAPPFSLIDLYSFDRTEKLREAPMANPGIFFSISSRYQTERRWIKIPSAFRGTGPA